MSVSGISSSLFEYGEQSIQNNQQQIQQEFQQLGQDLESGNLSAAQSDFATLQQLGPQSNSTSSTQSNNPIAQAFNQLAQDLQSGNLSAAQQDFKTIQQDFQNQAAQFESQSSQSQGTQGHHHHGGGDNSEISQLFDQLGQALQSGNLSTAQQVFGTLQQQFEQFSPSSQTSSGTSSSNVSLSA